VPLSVAYRARRGMVGTVVYSTDTEIQGALRSLVGGRAVDVTWSAGHTAIDANFPTRALKSPARQAQSVNTKRHHEHRLKPRSC
jgi:hypothetical protein